jgi:hypothetical protein
MAWIEFTMASKSGIRLRDIGNLVFLSRPIEVGGKFHGCPRMRRGARPVPDRPANVEFRICFASLQAETPSRRTERGLKITETPKSKSMNDSY